MRPEAKFDDMEALKRQMEEDCAKARMLLGARPNDYWRDD
ncbi:MAG: riboflavin kinase [Alteraurantiacibacter sp.]